MALRLRLKFQKGLLTDSQRSDGLNRSWFLVTSNHETVSDVVSHLLHNFDLSDTCPDGILLYLDGYALPPFETTRILRDKDLICVKKKGGKLTALLQHYVEKEQLENPGVQLLLGDELGKDESENEDDEDKNKQLVVLQEDVLPNVVVQGKKRKASKDTKSPKRKKQRQAVQDNDVQNAQTEHDDICLLNGDIIKKSLNNKQERIPELDAEEPDIVKHKTKAKRKRQQQLVPENDEQEAQKEHDIAWLLNGDLSSKEKKDIIPKSVVEDIDPEKHKAKANGNDENMDDTVNLSDASNRTGQSRSSRRKKLKRQWQRSARISEKEEQLPKKHSLEDNQKQSLEAEDDPKADLGCNKDQNLNTDNQGVEQDEGSDTEAEVVAVMVRPGHFRFTAPGKEKDVEQNDEAKDSFNWSGTINKRKGQKWGRENQPASKWNEYRAPCENQSVSKWNEIKASCENQSASKLNEKSGPCENQLSAKGGELSSPTAKLSDSIQNDSTTPSKICAPQEAPLETALMDYEKLAPMTDSPVGGDIIAYRLVELTSSFCPELTEYRVGKVSWFESESSRIMLVPVPQYPFELMKSADEDENASEELLETSSYNEDKSLEIELESLVDVRLVERSAVRLIPTLQHSANVTPVVHNKANGVPSCTEPPEGNTPSTPAQSIRNDEAGVNNSPSTPKPVFSSCPENGAKDGWEEISAALSAKKAELLEENWRKKRSPLQWSLRAARRSAVGPTLAFLRAQNNQETK